MGGEKLICSVKIYRYILLMFCALKRIVKNVRAFSRTRRAKRKSSGSFEAAGRINRVQEAMGGMYLRYYEYGRLVNQGWIFDTVANNMRLTKNVADFEVV